MSTLKAHNIEPATGTDVALGAAGDSITVSGDSLKLDTFKDSGGNTLFTSDGSGTLSNLNSGLKGGGGPILISSQTASNSASISFTSGIDNTYDKYMFVFVDISPASDGALLHFQANAVGESGYNEIMQTTNFTAYQTPTNSHNNVAQQTASDQALGTSFQPLCEGISFDADHSAAGILLLFNPSGTTYVKHFTSITQIIGSWNEMFATQRVAGYFNITAAIDEISFKMDSGNFDGKIKMYGIA